MSAPLDLAGDVVDLLRALIDIESVSGNEVEIADRVEEALTPHDHMTVTPDAHVILPRHEVQRA